MEPLNAAPVSKQPSAVAELPIFYLRPFGPNSHDMVFYRPRSKITSFMKQKGIKVPENLDAVIIAAPSGGGNSFNLKFPTSISINYANGLELLKALNCPHDVNPPYSPREFADLVKTIMSCEKSDKPRIIAELDDSLVGYRLSKEGQEGEAEIRETARVYIRMLKQILNKHEAAAYDRRSEMDKKTIAIEVEAARERKHASKKCSRELADIEEREHLRTDDLKGGKKFGWMPHILASVLPVVSGWAAVLFKSPHFILTLPLPVLGLSVAGSVGAMFWTGALIRKYKNWQIEKVQKKYEPLKEAVEISLDARISEITKNAADAKGKLEKDYAAFKEKAIIAAACQAFRIVMEIYPEYAYWLLYPLTRDIPDFRSEDPAVREREMSKAICIFKGAISKQVPNGNFNI